MAAHAVAAPADWYGPSTGPGGVTFFARSRGLSVELRDVATNTTLTLPREVVDRLDDDALAHELALAVGRARDPWVTLASGMSALRHRSSRR